MTAMTTPRGIRRLGALLLVFVALLSTGCTPEQTEILTLVNETRAEHGLPPLLPDLAAMDKAQAWAEHMAGNDLLAHSPSGQRAGRALQSVYRRHYCETREQGDVR